MDVKNKVGAKFGILVFGVKNCVKNLCFVSFVEFRVKEKLLHLKI